MRSSLPAGDLRDRITIKNVTSALDDSGQPIRSMPSDFAASVPCSARGVSGGESIRGRQMHAEATQLFVLRYLAGVTRKMRIVWNGITLGVVRVYDPIGDRVELWIEAKHEPA